MKQDYHQPLLADCIYHVFTRAIGNEKLYLSEGNYFYFLQKLKQHIAGVAQVYAYSLLPNHFHLLVKIRPATEIIEHYIEVKKKPYIEAESNLSEFIMERFGNLLNAYTKALNKMYKRKGNLFIDTMKRNKAENDDMITAFLFYIHKNAVHHGLVEKIGQWKFESYQSILSNGQTSLLRDEVINWFGDLQAFIKFHEQHVELKIEVAEF